VKRFTEGHSGAKVAREQAGYARVVSTGGELGRQIRGAELVAALCLASDLGMGFPFEHGLHSTLIAMRLAERLGADSEDVSRTYYAALLAHSGCTTDAHVTPEVFGGSLMTTFHPVRYGSGREVVSGLIRALPDPESRGLSRAGQVAVRLPRMAREMRPHLTATCEVAGMLAAGLGLPESVQRLFAHRFERWDGWGPLGRAKGDEIALPMRIVHLAVDAAFQNLLGGEERVVRLARDRAGHAFDPEVAGCLTDHAREILAWDQHGSVWEETLAYEPRPPLFLEGEAMDRALVAMGNFADLISPFLGGHSAAVAGLAQAAAQRCGMDEPDVAALRQAAQVHDLGRVAVPARIWQKPGPLNADEWEKVRLHSYYTERVLARSDFLAAFAPVAGAHHERLDGSGYHRGSLGAELTLPARMLAVADAYCAMTAPRPYREPLLPEEAADELAQEASARRLDADAVTAVLDAAGQHVPRLERPAGLTEREATVVGMLARGLQTKEIAAALGISSKTADRHIQNAYRKIGVSTRAAATLFAMEHGLLAWGELPIVRPAVGS
jgi:HD-GYP domain-containing protein (c-di-GMP phosphodiesterase class II)